MNIKELLNNWIKCIVEQSVDSTLILSINRLGMWNDRMLHIYYSLVICNNLEYSKINIDSFMFRYKSDELKDTFVIRIWNKRSIGNLEEYLKKKEYSLGPMKFEIFNKEKYIIFGDIESKEFFTFEFLQKLAKFIDYANVSVILEFRDGIPLSLIKILFRQCGYVLSSGNNTLKGVISRHNVILSRYILWIFGVDKGMEIIDNSFNEYTKNRVLTRSIFDITNSEDNFLINLIEKNNVQYNIKKEDLEKILSNKNLEYRKNNISVNDLSINDIRGLLYSSGERFRPNIKKKGLNSVRYYSSKKSDETSITSIKPISKTIKSNNIKTSHKLNIQSKRSFSTTTFIGDSKVKKKNNSFNYNSPLYQNLNILIKDNAINEKTQEKIERYLFDYSYICLDKSSLNKPFSGIDYSIINTKLSKLLLEDKERLIKIISNFKQDIITSKSAKKNKFLLEIVNIISEINNEFLVNIIYGRLLKIISTYHRSQDSLNSIVVVSYDLGRDLINNYYYYAYLRAKSNIDDKKYYLSDWKRDNKTEVEKYEDSTYMFKLGSVLVEWAITCDLLEINTVILGYKEKVNIVLPTARIKTTISNNVVFNLPKRIPMIVRPKPYTYKSLGGYLLNDVLTTDTLIKNKRNNKELTTIKDDNVIYDLVNNISSVGYKINKNVLDFILYYSKEYFEHEIVDVNFIHPFLEKSKLSKREKIELDSYLSKKELQENILGIASVFLNIPSFYIPVDLDFRGRLNCIPEFLNYQSNELAKSLLLYSKAEKIDKRDSVSIDYLKLYGATIFGLDKKSAQERLEWVDSNQKNIIDFRNGELIKKAKNKFLFVAFCFEYNRWLACLDNNDESEFYTHLPIQLDATCNGFQHLSLLSLDPKLALQLNLSESNWKDKPKDFYSFLLSNLIDYFKTELENNKNLSLDIQEGYKRLIDFNLQRYIIKKSIMTIPYNVSTFQLIKYIKENFVSEDNSNWFSTIEDNKLKLKYSDFALLGNGLRQVLDYKFPKLNLLLSYLDKLATVCTLLEIPILWALPSGLEVKQSYIMEDEIRIKPFFYNKNTFVLKVLNKSKYNNTKQIRAFMPNLVHSLDAASLALLLDFYFKGTKEMKNIYTVHDCFAVTANNVSNLLDLLKVTYIKIYSDNTYLRKLDKGIRDNIKNVYGEHSFDDKTLTINLSTNNTKISFPDVEVVLGKKIKLDFNSLLNSKYILN